MKKTILSLILLLSACASPPQQPETKRDVPTEVIVQAEATNAEAPAQDDSSANQTPLYFAAPLSAGPVTIVALGDSLTEGDGDESGRGYSGRLLDMINAIRPDSTLTNLGKSGWNSDALINGDQGLPGQLPQAASELQSASSQGKAALALVWIGSNDLWYLYEYGGAIGDAQEADDAAHFAANMDAILSALRGAGAEVVVALLDDQSYRPVALKGEAFTEITPNKLKRMSAHVQTYNQIIREKAEKYGALTVDFYSTDIFTNPATLYDDGNHPNSAGYDIIAQKWFDALAPLLK
ncbi:MAG: GDSL-type esterase/lipase family protein [Anaerolineales bacterium]|nr:GDSL-type esterase/lipase family protein [Anaerolineales bacterium]